MSASAGSPSPLSISDTALAVKVDVPGLGFTTSFDKPATSATNILSTGTTDASAVFSENGPVLSDVEVFPDHSDKDSGEEVELSDSEVTERNEEMNYRETISVVRTFLGWSHTPDFEPSTGDTDRLDNPWKGKYPPQTGKVSVELPANNWLCYKMGKLNSQESAGLKVEQFI